MKRNIFFISILLLGLCTAPAYSKSRPSLIIFYSPACSGCLKVVHGFMPGIEEKYKDKIDIQYLDIDNIQNYKLLLGYEEMYDKTKKNLPIVFIKGKFLSGKDEVIRNLEALILESLRQESISDKRPIPAIDLISRFKSFGILAIIFAGLIDGINPCAFSVIVFFITFLVFQKYGKREILITGACFIFAVFLTYFLLGLGLFRVLYTLKLFYFVGKLIYLLIALLVFILGALAIYDIFKFKKTGQAENMVLRLPQRLKYYIHYVIGLGYRKKQEPNQDVKGVSGLVISALLCGLIVSLLEAICTGQIYLPTIAFVLKISDLKIKALTYLAVYNLMFIIPLIVVFLLVLLGVTSEQFSKFMRKHIIIIKLLMAGLFFGLGIILIWGI